MQNTYGDEQHGAITASATRYGSSDNWYGNEADEDKLNAQLAYTFTKVGESIAKGYTSDMGAGNYVITAKWREGSSLADNYEIVNENTGTEYTVKKKPVSAPTIGSKSYTGGNLTADVDVEDKDYRVKTNNGGTDAGRYNVVLELNDPSNYMWSDTEDPEKTLEFEITQAENGWRAGHAFTLAGWQYDGTAHEATAEAQFGPVEFTYYNTATGDELGSAPKDAGTYRVKATVTETKNYAGITEEIGFEITKAPLTVTANAHSITYGDELTTDSGVTYGGFVAGESEHDLEGTLAFYSNDYRQYVSDVDSHCTITPQGYTSNNYEITFVSGTLTVTQREISVEIILPEDLTYGNIGEFGATLNGVGGREGVVNGDDVIYVLSFSGTPNKGSFTAGATVPTLAGTYTVEVTLAGTKVKNYILTGITEERFEIGKAAVKEPAEDTRTFTYNGREQEYTVALDLDLYTVSGNIQKNAGTHKVTIRLTDGDNYKWEEAGNSDDLSYDFIIRKADMGEAFNGTHMLKSQTHVYRSDMDAIQLKLPAPTDPAFPITWKSGAWTEDSVTVYYIIVQHQESLHDDGKISAYLQQLKDGADEKLWKEYAFEDAGMNVKDPMGYCVYFKVVDKSGNHNDYFSYFSVHIAHEELTIKLTDEARRGFEAGVEYGDVAHTKRYFEDSIMEGIASITSNEDATERKEQFIRNIANFTFYFRKDDPKTGDIYTVLDDGIHLYKDGSSLVDNLPLGKYYLYVTYNGDVGGEIRHVEFTWEGGRPSFEVTARKITVELTFRSYAYGEDFDGWVTGGVPTRTTAGKAGAWYAPGEQGIDLAFDYSLQTAGKPTRTTNAGTYNVIATWNNANYEVTFVNAAGGALTYTVEKASVERPGEDGTEFVYTGAKQTYHVEESSLYEVSGNEQTNANLSGYDVTIRLRDQQNYKWQGGDSGDLVYKFIIRKAPLTVTAKNKTITYGDAPSDGGVEYSGFVGGENENVLSGTPVFDYGGYERFSDAGDYEITPGGLSSDNYAIDYRQGTLTVKAKAIEVSWGEKSYTYTGSVLTDLPAAKAAGINGEDFTLEVSVETFPTDDGRFLYAGVYVLRAALRGDAAKNYTLTGDTKEYVIRRAELVVPGLGRTAFPYTGEEQMSAVVGVFENYDGTLMAYAFYADAEAMGDAIDSILNAGTYYVKFTITDPNYRWGDASDMVVPFAVTRRVHDDLTLTAKEVLATYGADPETLLPETHGVPQGFEVVYSYIFEGIDGTEYARTEEIPTDVGKYRTIVVAVYAGGMNDEPFTLRAETTLTIMVRALTFYVEPASGTDTTVTVVFRDSEGNAVVLDAEEYDLTYTYHGVAVEELNKKGEYTVTVVLKGRTAHNNVLLNGTGVYTLAQADLDFGIAVVLLCVQVVLAVIILIVVKKKKEKSSENRGGI